MATQRRKPAEIAASPPPAVVDGMIPWPTGEVDDDDDSEQTTVDRVIGMLANSGGAERAYVRVSRVLGGKVEFCTKYSVADFEAGDLAMIRDHWGPGEYQLQVYGMQPGTNRFVILTRETVLVAAPRTPVAAAAAPVSDLAAYMQQMADSQRELLRAITERPQVDSMASMRETLAMMTMFREAMGLGASGGGAPKNALADVVAAMRELRAVSEEINPPAREPGLMGAVEKMLPLIQAGLAQHQQRAAVATPAAPALPSPQPPAASPAPATPDLATSQPETEDVNAIDMIKLKGHLATLVAMARAEGPIDTAAQLVYDELPDLVIALMESDKWFDDFVQVAPEAKPFEAWFQKVRTAAQALFDEPEGDAT